MADLPQTRRLSTPPVYSAAEEIAHSVSHGLGALLAIAGLAVLAARAAMYGEYLHIVACSMFGMAMLLTYLASAIYHSVPLSLLPTAKDVLRAIDQAFVYVLIAGTYTPFCLLVVDGPLGPTLFIATWTVALTAIAFRMLAPDTHERIALWIYLALGWGALPLMSRLSEGLPREGLWLLIAGGCAYTAGVGFYLQTKMRYHHAIWHLFTLLGSALHYFAVLLYVIPSI
ncbi:MAG: hemolysin III family protein [Nevskiaceae bacterium]|nr:MAG: hemolysin III family protein [Nevskiaceae bacterium]TAM22035.1 MAG: hemolysin III family protein [Nevskiaceae bacterium]